MESPGPLIERTYGGISAEERRNGRRQKLLAAGRELFGTEGLERTSIRAILEESGLAIRYFSESFDSKIALFEAVYDGILERIMIETVVAVQAVAGDAAAEVRTGLSAFFRAATADPRDARILLIEAVAAGPEQFNRALNQIEIFTALIAERAAAVGELPEWLNLRLIASALVGATDHLEREYAFRAETIPLQVIIDHATFVFNSLLTSLETVAVKTAAPSVAVPPVAAAPVAAPSEAVPVTGLARWLSQP